MSAVWMYLPECSALAIHQDVQVNFVSFTCMVKENCVECNLIYRLSSKLEEKCIGIS